MIYLRLVIGPVVVCDIDLFSTIDKPDPGKEPPPQLAGGQGQVVYPEPVEDEAVFGFRRASRPSL